VYLGEILFQFLLLFRFIFFPPGWFGLREIILTPAPLPRMRACGIGSGSGCAGVYLIFIYLVPYYFFFFFSISLGHVSPHPCTLDHMESRRKMAIYATRVTHLLSIPCTIDWGVDANLMEG